MVAWRTLAAQVDAAVNEQFGERVRLVPMRREGYAPSVFDPSRQAIEVVGVFNTQDDRAMSLTGDHSGQQLRSRASLGVVRLHVPTPAIADFNVLDGDRVIMLERDGDEYEITRFVHQATDTTLLELVRGKR